MYLCFLFLLSLVCVFVKGCFFFFFSSVVVVVGFVIASFFVVVVACLFDVLVCRFV